MSEAEIDALIAFNGNTLQAHRHRQMFAAIVKKLRVFDEGVVGPD
jgi:hypothetical protein